MATSQPPPRRSCRSFGAGLRWLSASYATLVDRVIIARALTLDLVLCTLLAARGNCYHLTRAHLLENAVSDLNDSSSVVSKRNGV
jgi:hypothetical protein